MVRKIADLERFRKERWYRIPVSSRVSPRRCRYLAVYPIRSCGPGGGKIEYYAPIESVVRRRRDRILPGEKSHPRAREVYWKLLLGRPRRLRVPVANLCRRRLTFAYTTLENLRAARELGELFSVPPLEVILADILVRLGVESVPQYAVTDRCRIRYRLDFAVFRAGEKIDLECDHSRWHGVRRRREADRRRDRWLNNRGWRVIRLTEREILSGEAGELVKRTLRPPVSRRTVK